MNNDTQQEQTVEQKLLRLNEGMVPPRVVIPNEQKGMVPVTFIPPIIQQAAQTDAGQPSQQTTSTPQSTTTQQTQSSEQSQSNGNKFPWHCWRERPDSTPAAVLHPERAKLEEIPPAVPAASDSGSLAVAKPVGALLQSSRSSTGPQKPIHHR